MDLIEEYLQNIKMMKLSLDDYGDKRKVKNSNQLADRNRKIVKLIAKGSNEIKLEYVSLLDSDDEDVRGWVAHHILELMKLDKPIRLKALGIINDEANNHRDSVCRLGNSMWLKQYYQKHPNDLEIR